MRCKVCGANLPVESLFCYACGYRLDKKINKKRIKKRTLVRRLELLTVMLVMLVQSMVKQNLMLLEDMVLLLKEQITYMIKLQATMHSL